MIKNNIVTKIKNIKLYGFSGLSFYDLYFFLKTSLKNSNYSVKSSAIAFDFFMAIFPAIIFLITLLPVIPIPNFQEILLDEIKLITPSNAYDLFEITLNNLVNNKYYGLLSVGLILVIYYSSNALNTLIDVLNDSQLIKKEYKTIKQRLLAIGLFLKFSFFIILTVLINFGINKMNIYILPTENNYLITIFLSSIKWLMILYFLIIAISIIFRYAQSDELKVKFINAGTLSTAIIIIIASISVSYFFDNFSNYNKVYGSIGGLLITLIWMRICCFITVVGFDLYMKVGLKEKNDKI